MEIVSGDFDGNFNNRSCRRRRVQLFTGGYRSGIKTVTFGGRNRRFWKIKAIPRLRLKKASPIRLWMKLKNAYINLMLRYGGTENVFGCKRVPRMLQQGNSGGYSMEGFQSRLLYEISKNLCAARELGTVF